MRNFEVTTRSVVVTRQAMAATSHPLATQTAVQILSAGGNAVDAAIAACAVQCVVEPGMTGIGGDCFVLFSKEGSADVRAFNGSGRAPAGTSAEALRAAGKTGVERRTPEAVTIPGAIDAWFTLHSDHGRLPWAEVLAPAIRFAAEGYAITPRVHRDWAGEAAFLAGDENAARMFLPRGRAPRIGEVINAPALAETLRIIAREGRDGFYKGRVAEDMVEYLQQKGGVHTLADFAAAKGDYVQPISTSFRGHEVHECPPNGQGVIALMIMNILSRFPAKGDPVGADRVHVEIEATRLAYAARDSLLADPAHSPVPVEELLSDAMADRLAGLINLDRALTELPDFEMPKHPDTVYITVVDKDRNAVSFINSVFDCFGSGYVTPRTGIVLHNRGQSFSLKKGHPNLIAAGKRPLHTIIPGMVTKEGRTEMSFGVMGGYYQALGHGNFISKVLDYGLDMQMAMELPRVMPVSGSTAVEAEHTLPADVVAELTRRGFEVRPSPEPIGGSQAIRIDWDNGTLFGASEPRKDGFALGL